jgi:4-hydroxybenzoate polyprenyltransferase
MPHRIGLAVACVLAIAATAAGTALGAWWLPFAVGLLLGAWAHGGKRWRTLGAIVVVAAMGWALPLAWMAVRGQDVAGVAATVSALTGLPRSAAVGLAAALLVCCLQAIAGAALGRTLTNALTSAS